MTIETDFLNYAADKLTQLCGRIETCLLKLTPEQIWMRGTENQNAVGNLVLHLSGNVGQGLLRGLVQTSERGQDHGPVDRGPERWQGLL